MSVRALTDLERGSTVRPRPSTVRLLAEALRLDPSERQLLFLSTTNGDDGRLKQANGRPAAQGLLTARRRRSAAVPLLVGRDRELRLLDDAADDGLVVVSGPGGIGKTALAQLWVRTAAGRDPDALLSVDLRGFSRDGDPMPAVEALRRLVVALGDAPEGLPDDSDELTARYRVLTAERRTVLLLDNARSSEQVRPLLPAGAGSITVVTSRRRLDGLIAGQGAALVSLGPLAPAAAVELLSQHGTTAPPDRLRALAAACGHLPLALIILSAQLRSRPERVLDADWEHPGPGELDLLDVEDGDLSVRSVLDVTVRTLPAGTARLVSLLGLWPGEDLDPHAAAALLGCQPSSAVHLLDRISELHLVEERAPGRYRIHDLIAAYCRERATALAPEEQLAARTRLCRYALTLLHRADRIVRPDRDHLPVDLDDTLATRSLDDQHGISTMLAEDSPTLLAVTRQAQREAHAPFAWQLPYMLRIYFERRGSLSDRIEFYRTALDLTPADDPIRPALHNCLGIAYARSRRFDLARDAFLSAVELAQDPVASATYSENLGTLHLELGELDAAKQHLLRALQVKPVEPTGRAFTLGNLGRVLAQQGRSTEAVLHLQEALQIAEDARDDRLAGQCLLELGCAQAAAGDRAAALRYFQAARGRATRAADDTVLAEAYDQAAALLPVDSPERRSWQHIAERLYRRMDDPRAEDLISNR